MGYSGTILFPGHHTGRKYFTMAEKEKPVKVQKPLTHYKKRQEHKADQSTPTSAEVKDAWSYTYTPQYAFMAWCLIKHRDNFIFNLYLP
jgi:hypothetical protein